MEYLIMIIEISLVVFLLLTACLFARKMLDQKKANLSRLVDHQLEFKTIL